jgi:hypothetical protein
MKVKSQSSVSGTAASGTAASGTAVCGTQAVGIDLAGFSTGTTVVAVAAEDGDSIHCRVMDSHPLSRRRGGDDDLAAAIAEETDFFAELAKLGEIIVDVPIDLQSLKGIFLPAEGGQSKQDASRIVELYKRPIDETLRALSPVADRLAAPVIRFAAIARNLEVHHPGLLVLGENLFETYPKPSFENLIAGSCRGYKSSNAYTLHGRVFPQNTPIRGPINLLERISFTHGVVIESRGTCEITDHVVDAIFCAVLGLKSFEGVVVQNRKELLDFGCELGRIVPEKLELPRGYRILGAWPNAIKRIVIEQA